MRKFLALAIFLCLSLTAIGQAVSFYLPVTYSKYAPTKAPKSGASNLWFNTSNSCLYRYVKDAGWENLNAPNHAQFGISNDTLSISFAGTTADTLQGMTAGSLSGFSLSSDGGVLTYNGTRAKTFSLNYSASFTFAEAVVVSSYLVRSGTIIYPTKTRVLGATAGNMVSVSGTAIVSLSPGQTLSLFFVPATHTGTDALTVYEANVTLTEL